MTKCPTFIMHGANDEEVPVEHGKMMKENAGNCSEIWIAPNCGHNDIDSKQNLEFYKKILWFLRDLDKNYKAKSEEEVFKMNKADPWPEKYRHMYKRIERDLVKTHFNPRGNFVVQGFLKIIL